MSSNEYEVMIDIETLGTEPGNIITTVALVPFDRDKEESFEELTKNGSLFSLSVKEQLDLGYSIDIRTLVWWLETNPKLLHTLLIMEPEYNLRSTITEIHNICEKAVQVWSKGYIDHTLLQYMCKQELDRDLVSYFRKPSDLRTLTKNCSFTAPVKPEGMIKHNPIHDAAYQVLVLKAILGG